MDFISTAGCVKGTWGGGDRGYLLEAAKSAVVPGRKLLQAGQALGQFDQLGEIGLCTCKGPALGQQMECP